MVGSDDSGVKYDPERHETGDARLGLKANTPLTTNSRVTLSGTYLDSLRLNCPVCKEAQGIGDIILTLFP